MVGVLKKKKMFFIIKYIVLIYNLDVFPCLIETIQSRTVIVSVTEMQDEPGSLSVWEITPGKKKDGHIVLITNIFYVLVAYYE